MAKHKDETSPLLSYTYIPPHNKNKNHKEQIKTTKEEYNPASSSSNSTVSSSSTSTSSSSSSQSGLEDEEYHVLYSKRTRCSLCIIITLFMFLLAVICLVTKHTHAHTHTHTHHGSNSNMRGHATTTTSATTSATTTTTPTTSPTKPTSTTSTTTTTHTHTHTIINNLPTKSKKKQEWNTNQQIAQKAFDDNLKYHPLPPHSNVTDTCRAAIVIIRHCEKGNVKEHCNDVGFQRAQYIATLFGDDDDDDDDDGYGGGSGGGGIHHNEEDVDDDDDDYYYDDDGVDDDRNSHHYNNHNHNTTDSSTTIQTIHASKWPAPSFLFATNPGHRKHANIRNYREIETIQPLSDKLQLYINSQYGMNNAEELTKKLYDLLRRGELCGKVALIAWKHEDIPRLARSLGCGPYDGCPLTWDGQDFDSTWQLLYSYRVQQYPDVSSLDQVEDGTGSTSTSTSNAGDEEKDKQQQAQQKTHTLPLESMESWRQHQKPQWYISAHVQMEDFDPLAFGKGKFYNKKKKKGHHHHHGGGHHHHHHHGQEPNTMDHNHHHHHHHQQHGHP